MSNCIGLDISKRLIAVHIPKNSLDIEINNNITGMKKLSSKLKKLYKKEYDDLVFIYEPTGNYSAVLTKYCHTKNIRCFIINPSQFSNHAKALGQRVKSDKIDAQVLSKALHLARDDKLSKGYENIRTVTGIADIGGIALLHLFIKYPDANQREITSLAGLDPIDRSSGTSIHSKSKISNGCREAHTWPPRSVNTWPVDF